MQYFIDHTVFPLYLVLCILKQYCVCLLFLLSCIISDWYLEKKQKKHYPFHGKNLKAKQAQIFRGGLGGGLDMCVT